MSRARRISFKARPRCCKTFAAGSAAEGITAKAALADTAGCAWAMARYGNETIVSPGRASEAIASLPVAALRLSKETVTSLQDVGIERVAQLATKPRASLRLRFGADILLAARSSFWQRQ